jgi:hypothetical protein
MYTYYTWSLEDPRFPTSRVLVVQCNVFMPPSNGSLVVWSKKAFYYKCCLPFEIGFWTGVPHHSKWRMYYNIGAVGDPSESIFASNCNESALKLGTVLNRRHFVRLVSFSTYYTLALHQKRLVRVYHFVCSVTIGWPVGRTI